MSSRMGPYWRRREFLFGRSSARWRCNIRVEPLIFPSKSRLVEPPTSTVERSHKGDRLMHFQTSGGASYSIAVEVTATSNVIVRDKGGNILFAVDQSSRTTTVGKQIKRRAVVPGPGEAERELPDGCEGAFSPYAEPSKARIIGRCVS
jgi:hypothetical protein